jgi:hypothetical protein
VTGDVFCRNCGARLPYSGNAPTAVPPANPPPGVPAPTKHDRSRGILIGALAAGAVLLIGLGVLLMMDSDSGDEVAATVEVSSAPMSTEATATVPGGEDQGAGVSALGSDGAAGEIFLEPAGAPGPDSFTGGEVFAEPVVATTAPVVTTTTESPTTTTTLTGQVVAEGRSGDRPGLYGGTRDTSRCDAAAIFSFLQISPAEAEAWVAALNSDPSLRWGEDRTSLAVADLGEYFSELTPVTLIEDTRVTNHGFRDGKPTPRQSVLQAGTAVLVDRFGVPRAKCACGNPLIPPKAAQTTPTYVGTPWPGWGTTIVVVIQPAVVVIEDFVLIDMWDGTTFERPAGTSGTEDSADGEVSVFVIGPMEPAGGYETNASYDGATFTVDLDPSHVSWIAFSGVDAPVDQPAGVGSDRSPDGIMDIVFADVDDFLFVEVWKDGASASAILHGNDAMGTPGGNQAVIYGYHPSVWFVSNIDWSTNPATSTTTTGPETGELTAFFDEQGAGTYEISVSYMNMYTDRVSHGDLYLIAGN